MATGGPFDTMPPRRLGYIEEDAGLGRAGELKGEWFLVSDPMPPLIPYTRPSDDRLDAVACALFDIMNKAVHPFVVVDKGVRVILSKDDPMVICGIEPAGNPAAAEVYDAGQPGTLSNEGHPTGCKCQLCIDDDYSRRWEGALRTRRKPEAVFDYDAIANRVAQLRGDAPSGRYFKEAESRAPGDRRPITHTYLVQDGHDWDFPSDRCTRCLHTYMGMTEGFAPKVCPGKVTGERCIECGKNAVQTAGASGAAYYKVWCLACGHSIWVDKRKPVKLRPIAQSADALGHQMCLVDPICVLCNRTHNQIVNSQIECEAIPF